MLYNSAAECFYTKKVYSRLSSREVKFRRQKNLNCCFCAPPSLVGVRDNLCCSYWAHWKARSRLTIRHKLCVWQTDGHWLDCSLSDKSTFPTLLTSRILGHL